MGVAKGSVDAALVFYVTDDPSERWTTKQKSQEGSARKSDKNIKRSSAQITTAKEIP